MKYGLVLEGGGAKGSYQVGAMKALIENGFEFSCVTGTSIGAINAALIAQGDFDLLYEMWQTMSYDDLFDIDKQYINKLLKLYVGKDTIKYLTVQIKKAIKEKGIDTSKIRKLLNEKIDEEKLRKSDVDFGLVTYCLSDQRAQEIFLEDMPKGKIVDYIMASSNLPVFKRAKIDDKHYLDGGIYDNCPVHMLEKKGYKEVYVIRAFKKNRIRGYNAILKRAKTTIHMIEPVKELSHILDFRRDVIDNQLKLGYYDALKVIKKLDGYNYYINSNKDDEIYNKIINLDIQSIIQITKDLNIEYKIGENIKLVYIEKVLPYLVSKTTYKYAINNKQIFYSLLEYILQKKKVLFYKEYDLDALLEKYIIKSNYVGKNIIDKAIYTILKIMTK